MRHLRCGQLRLRAEGFVASHPLARVTRNRSFDSLCSLEMAIGWGTQEFVVDGLGFFAGEAGDIGDGIFAGDWVFGDLRGMDLERKAGLGEQFAASGRG